MSWEEMYTYSATCPYGKGKITQTSYGDDWNRYKDGSVKNALRSIKSKKYLITDCSPQMVIEVTSNKS